MTKSELLQLMQREGAISALKQWEQSKEEGDTLDLSGEDLTRINFTDATIENADLSRTTWRDNLVMGLRLVSCDLTGSHWHSSMAGASMEDCALAHGKMEDHGSFMHCTRKSCSGESSIFIGRILRPMSSARDRAMAVHSEVGDADNRKAGRSVARNRAAG